MEENNIVCSGSMEGIGCKNSLWPKKENDDIRNISHSWDRIWNQKIRKISLTLTPKKLYRISYTIEEIGDSNY